MAYALPNFTNNTGMEEVLQYGSQQVPILAPVLLFMVWIIIAVSGYYSQQRQSVGGGNFLMWASIGGLITTTGAFFLFLYDNIVNLQTITLFVVITILSVFGWFISDRD